MKRLTTLLLVLIATLLIAVPISAQEEDEDDDPTLLSVPLLETDFLVIDEMEHFGDPQLFAFMGTAGDEVTITMAPTPGSRLDPYLLLIGAAGEVLAANDDRSVDDLSAQIEEYELPFDGAYFVLATTFNDLIQGGTDGDDDENGPYEYQIIVEGAELPAGIVEVEEFEYFASIAESAEPVLLETTESEPIWFMEFFAEEGDVVFIETSQTGDEFVSTLLYVFNRFGERVAVASGGEGGDDLYAVIEDLEIEEEGLYFVFVTSNTFYLASENDDWSGYGSFVFELVIE